jgi:acyl-coenzyme A synthetase/AMP-(fatty) acid ligase
MSPEVASQTTALGLIHSALQQAHDRPMVERRGQWYLGQDLLDRIYARAADLKVSGLKPDDVALIVVSDNLIAFEQLLACWMLGASAAFVDFRTPPARISHSATQLAAQVIIGLKGIDGIKMHIQPGNPDMEHAPIGDMPDRPDSNAIHFSSSGTTGPPRFTPSTHSKLASGIINNDKARDWPIDGAAISAISLAYSASCYLWLIKLASGQPIVTLDIVHRLSELDNSLKRPDVSEAGLAPAQIRRLLEIKDTDDQQHRYPQLVILATVGGPSHPKEAQDTVTRLCPNFRMIYSAVGIGRIARIVGEEIIQKPASVGRVMSDLDVKIYDGDRVCAAGEVGEISISHALFTDKRPGDMGYFDDDGYLYITGRVQGLLCRNGVNFNAQRITQAAMDHHGVSNAEVVSKPDSDQGDIVYLVIEADEGDIETVRQSMRKHLPIAEHPDHIVAMHAIPVTASLKNDLPAIRSIVLGEHHDS